MRLAVVMMALCCACSGSDKKYYLPVDSPARPFTPPEAEDLVEDDGDSWDTDTDTDTDSGDSADPEAAARAVTMTLVRSRRAFETCYTKALERAPQLRGRVELVVQVGPDGKATSAKATGLAGVAACVAKVAEGLVFPKPAGGKPVTVSHPFVFAPPT
jgi:hypothetical protein